MTSYRNLHRFIVFTACCTFLLIIAGGLVTSTQSGLSVPDWPNTYGHFMFAFPLDQMVGGIFYEHSHRMIASAVGFLTVVMSFWIWKREDRKWVTVLGFAALGAVIAQGVLGGLTVLFLLPTAISVSHATLAQTFFCLVSALALVTSRWWRDRQPTLQDPSRGVSITRLASVTTGVIFIQLVLGALMRHTQSGLAVPDFPLAYGQVFPSLTPEAIETYNKQLIHANIQLAADDAITASQIVIHMLHRLWAVVASVFVFWTSLRLIRLSGSSARLARFGYALGGLLILQICLGGFTVLTLKAVDITTAHVATGALLLVTSLLVTLQAARIFGFPRREPSYAYREQQVTA